MNYERTYEALCEGSTESKDIYTENHHIIPKCMGGSDESSNMVRLTAKAHFAVSYTHLTLSLIHI